MARQDRDRRRLVSTIRAMHGQNRLTVRRAKQGKATNGPILDRARHGKATSGPMLDRARQGKAAVSAQL